MKWMQLAFSVFSFRRSGRILILLELIVGLHFLFLCVGLLEKNRQIDAYMERYIDLAAADPENPEQMAYAEANGIVFETSRQLTPAEPGGRPYFGEVNSRAFYRAVPLKLKAGQWFPGEEHGCRYEAVVPYSLRRVFPCGRRLEISFLETGPVSVYVCGVLDSDITFGNSYAAGFDDENVCLLLCPAGQEEATVGIPTRACVKLEKLEPEVLSALDMDAVILLKEELKESRRESLALSLFLSMILLVLFSTALLGDYYLSAREKEKSFAICFMCGMSVKRAMWLGSCSSAAGFFFPALISLALAWAFQVRLYPLYVLGIFLILAAGSFGLSFIQMKRIGRESPAQIIARRFRQ